MSLYDKLLTTYGTNEPILSNEIEYEGYSRPWLYKELNRLCESGQLVRYEKGIYYIPVQTPLGSSVLNPGKVIEKKYIRNTSGTIGYYSGATFLNRLGLSSQMPNTIEIYTNNETAKVREVTVGKQKVILRKARTPINADNAAIQSFLELMNAVPASFFDDERRALTTQFIVQNNITRKAITQYAPAFPDRAMRTMIESEVIYSVAQ